MSNQKTVLFAVGGTGGHLFPAQALAQELKQKKSQIEIFFAGGHLKSSPYFQNGLFPYQEISSATVFKKNVFSLAKSLITLVKGLFESYALLRKVKPALVVGFGSFHAFPLLCAAILQKIPFILFNPDVVPGKVNRLFSKRALFSAVQFLETQKYIKGAVLPVHIPLLAQQKKEQLFSKEAAKGYYNLDPKKKTLLVFGGSQGAKVINQVVPEIMTKDDFQIIHLAGNEAQAQELISIYKKMGIRFCVKSFEDKMAIAWAAADLAICRAGAMTLAEMIAFEVPAVMIPYPYAYAHQKKNAELMEQEIGGGVLLEQSQLNVDKLSETLNRLMAHDHLMQMKEHIKEYKQKTASQSLSHWIIEYLKL